MTCQFKIYVFIHYMSLNHYLTKVYLWVRSHFCILMHTMYFDTFKLSCQLWYIFHITFKYKFKSLFHINQDGRVVKALDSRSNRQCLRGFESHSWYFVVDCILTHWIVLLTLISLCITFKYKFKSLFHNYQDGRAVKALDLSSNRQCLRGFKSHSWYFVVCWLHTLYFACDLDWIKVWTVIIVFHLE